MRIYLDYAASTPVDPEVFAAMRPFFCEKFGNPSSLHSFGREAEMAIDDAREIAARFFAVDQREVYFTSGATEGNNWIVRSVIESSRASLGEDVKPHIITSAIEHDSLRDSCKHAEKEGMAEITYLKPTKEGMVRPEDMESALKENTVLVSLMYVNNETGAVQKIKEIGGVVKRFRAKTTFVTESDKAAKAGYQKLKTQNYPIFHTDAVQAIQFFEPRLDYLNVDAMTVSGHKIYGAKGTGALLVKHSFPLTPLIYGGGQESEKRSGTENVAGIAGFGKAIEKISDAALREKEKERLEELKKMLILGIMEGRKNVEVVCGNSSSPHILSVILHGIEAQIFLIGMDKEGVAVSSGSACSVKALNPSHVLLACGYSAKDASSAIRFSLGRFTTEKEIKETISIAQSLLNRLR